MIMEAESLIDGILDVTWDILFQHGRIQKVEYFFKLCQQQNKSLEVERVQNGEKKIILFFFSCVEDSIRREVRHQQTFLLPQ